MRARFPSADTALIAAHIEAAAGFEQVRALLSSFADASPETVNAILEEASRFADEALAPLNDKMDAEGVKIVEGRVVTARGHKDVWEDFIESGWPTLVHPTEYGGQQLPLSLGLAVQELFDRACPAFGMLPVPQRSAAMLIATYADNQVIEEWLPGLVDGSIGATICISEAGAGSDVAQMHARATQDSAGRWRITGEKCWISYGDHDLTKRIVHCVLARSDDPISEKPEISLFLVGGGACQPQAVVVRRIEEKLGLHGSPTCAIGFEGANATLIGKPGRGLAQMFVMITQMRLAVGVMGLGIASASADIAFGYAEDRRQGGKPGKPVAIINHPDVQRQLLEMISCVEMLRGLILSTANLAEVAAHAPTESDRAEAEAVVQWLLPIVKTMGSQAAFANASGAIQIFGGAGYTREWPVEQALRDARVLTIFEGTSGIQALDLVHRRVLRDQNGMQAFVRRARENEAGQGLTRCLDLLEDAALRFQAMDRESGDMEAGASAFLDLAILAAGGWIAAQFTTLDAGNPSHDRMRTAANYWLERLSQRAALAHAEALAGIRSLAGFQALG